jgi:hypothetical protein
VQQELQDSHARSLLTDEDVTAIALAAATTRARHRMRRPGYCTLRCMLPAWPSTSSIYRACAQALMAVSWVSGINSMTRTASASRPSPLRGVASGQP